METYYGLRKTTLLDYPGEVAASIFVPGCNFRCPYCHNPDLAYGRIDDSAVNEIQLESFLQKRRAVLGGVCISGGEPLSSDNIFSLVKLIKELGYKVKIDTNGSFPSRLKELMINFDIDHVAMDIKTSLDQYKLVHPQASRIKTEFKNGKGHNDVIDKIGTHIDESIQLLAGSSVEHHFRTTVVPGIVSPKDIQDICALLPKGECLLLQQFRPDVTLDASYQEVEPYTMDVFRAMQSICIENGIRCELHGIADPEAHTSSYHLNREMVGASL